ncbi:hypothetical protein F909_03887 [Acinetobacter sp. ANC 3929]|uniref:DUF2303 family protein n=1 Tax=Acinetobacter sp. ANC 3929 TaxID=1217707 RepID=UPI0002D0577A|nr:DUF2303 family protein [Acinetobacter sp. ANC 3929]ENW78201.1 hypothetical protein F909_03887 [Acinetobacter sp. ANC 3929]
MEQSAIEKITQLAIAAQGKMPINVDSSASIAIIPADFKVHSLEQFNQNRDRFRGRFSTLAIAAFIAYVSDRGVNGIKSFISTKNGLSAETIFNIGDEVAPGHGDDTARLNLEKTPEFIALENIDGDRFSQQKLIDWLDDWADFVKPHDANGPLQTEKALRAIRNVKIGRSHDVDSDVRDMGQKLSVTESVEAEGVVAGLPTHFILTTESYKGLPVEEIKISFRISTKDDVPTFVLRFVGRDAHNQLRADQFTEILESELADLGSFYQGSYQA